MQRKPKSRWIMPLTRLRRPAPNAGNASRTSEQSDQVSPIGSGKPPLRHRSIREDLAICLAYKLGDMGSLGYYHRLAERWESGRLCRTMTRADAGRLLIDKADTLGRQRPPAGPIRNPGAVFVNWVKMLT